METNKSVTIQVETVGQAYLEVLRARGIKYFFGTAARTLGRSLTRWRALARRKKSIRCRLRCRMSLSR